MWLQMFFILPFIISARSIIVPVDQNEGDPEESPNKKVDTAQNPIYYVSDDTDVDSYLIPPDPHRLEEVLPDNIVTPATYLLPPSPDQQSDYYYNPTEPEEQTDWYPILPNAPSQKPEAIPIKNANPKKHIEGNSRRSKTHDQTYAVPTPSLNLEPPLEDAPNVYLAPTTSEQTQIPESIKDYDLPIETTPNKELPFVYRPKLEPRLSLHLIPPQQPYILKKYPKKLYPKKFNGEFKPVAIPIAQYADESASGIPRAKPVQLFKPLPSTEVDYLTPSDEKINYLYRKAENKQRLKGEELRQESPIGSIIPVEDTFEKTTSTEQDTSESFRLPGHHTYRAPLKQKPTKAPKSDVSSVPAPDERTEFRMHGMKGPHSYQFGYDTGKGKNRQFRYEERDNDGQVKGHYGYMDRYGKLRVVNYSAHPDTGFHADASVEKES